MEGEREKLAAPFPRVKKFELSEAVNQLRKGLRSKVRGARPHGEERKGKRKEKENAAGGAHRARYRAASRTAL